MNYKLPLKIQRWRVVFLVYIGMLCTSPMLLAAVEKTNAMDRIVAIVNDDVITSTELDKRIQLLKRQKMGIK